MEPGFRLESALSVLPVLEIINHSANVHRVPEYWVDGCELFRCRPASVEFISEGRRAVNKYVNKDYLLANTVKCH